MADIPGLIAGAAEGKGLGLEFLRHTERARALVILIDPAQTQLETPERQLEVLSEEVQSYSEDLASRPRLVLVNKSDLDGAQDVAARLGAQSISAVTGEGVTEALHAIADLVEQAEREAPERRGFVLYRPLGPTFKVSREGDAWRVAGQAAERAVRFADLTLDEAADMAAKRLAGLGVDEALATAGAVEGDEVRIGDLSFEYVPEGFEEE